MSSIPMRTSFVFFLKSLYGAFMMVTPELSMANTDAIWVWAAGYLHRGGSEYDT